MDFFMSHQVKTHENVNHLRSKAAAIYSEQGAVSIMYDYFDRVRSVKESNSDQKELFSFLSPLCVYIVISPDR